MTAGLRPVSTDGRIRAYARLLRADRKDRRKGGKGKGKASAGDQGEVFSAELAEALDEEDLPGAWPLALAYGISKLSSVVQNELMSNGAKLIKYYIEWCSTPTKRAPGVCFTDACYIWSEGFKELRLTPKSPSNNVYAFIPHALRDPLELDVASRANKFIRTTFWRNLRLTRVPWRHMLSPFRL